MIELVIIGEVMYDLQWFTCCNGFSSLPQCRLKIGHGSLSSRPVVVLVFYSLMLMYGSLLGLLGC